MTHSSFFSTARRAFSLVALVAATVASAAPGGSTLPASSGPNKPGTTLIGPLGGSGDDGTLGFFSFFGLFGFWR